MSQTGQQGDTGCVKKGKAASLIKERWEGTIATAVIGPSRRGAHRVKPLGQRYEAGENGCQKRFYRRRT